MKRYYIYDTGRTACYLNEDGDIHFCFALGNHCDRCNKTFYHIDFEEHLKTCKRKNVFDVFDMEWTMDYFPPVQLNFINEFKKAKGGKYLYGKIDNIIMPAESFQAGVNQTGGLKWKY